MVTWHIVDDDVECLHVQRNPTMTCSGSHLYKFYRFAEEHDSQINLDPLICRLIISYRGASCCVSLICLIAFLHSCARSLMVFFFDAIEATNQSNRCVCAELCSIWNKRINKKTVGQRAKLKVEF
jgi:hypothetical protein